MIKKKSLYVQIGLMALHAQPRQGKNLEKSSHTPQLEEPDHFNRELLT